MTRWAILVSIVVGTFVFAFGFAQIEYFLPCILIFVLGAGWIYAQWSGVEWASMAGLIGAGMIGGSGILIGANSAWMLAGVLFSLLAWDLIEFQTRLSFAASVSDAKLLERKHLWLLGALSVLTMALYLATTLIHFELGLWWLILLAFILTFGIIQLLWKLR